MNYRSRIAHQRKTRASKFLLDEHEKSYDQLCARLKEAKALMDKLGLRPSVRPHNHQSMRFVNLDDESVLT